MSFAFMPFYTGDYYRDTRHLSMLQHGAYRQLLDHCWDQKGPLPLDMARCFRICGAVSKEEQDAVVSVVGEFFIQMEDGHYNRRMQLEIERAASISEARSGAAHTRWKARQAVKSIDDAVRHANAMQVHSKSNASGPPSPPPSQPQVQPRKKTTSAPNAVAFDAVEGLWEIPDALKAKWVDAYPAVNVETELSKAAVWLMANPANHKSNYARFLSNWLTRAQDKAPRLVGVAKQDKFAGAL